MTLSNQTKEILDNKIQLRKLLSQVIPSDLIDYIMELIVKDQTHQKFLELTKD